MSEATDAPNAVTPERSGRGGLSGPGVHRIVVAGCTLAAVVALVLLGVRSFTRLETWWDAWLYHVPFAADYGRLGVPYTTLDRNITTVREGFPPLPFIAHALLWRLTGSLNAVGVRNFLAFGAFLYFATRVLRARLSIVALVALTSPLVVIHAASTYYDLFANSFMAIGTTGIVGLFLFDRQHERPLLLWVLFGLIGAAWSKIILIPLVAIALGSLFVYYVRARPQDKAWTWIVACAAISAVPYLRNLLLFHNPIWPFPIPFLPRVPYALDFIERETPPLLVGAPHYEIFIRSLFEINQPVSYPSRARYIIDQGRAFAGFRSGGFWGIGVMAYLAMLGGLAALYSKRKAAWLGIGAVGTLALIAVLPDAHNLRYVMFLPLSWAALIGMFERRLSDRFPWLMSGVLVVASTLFGYMAYVNEEYFRIESIDYKKAAAAWGADEWWPALEHDDLYCAVKPPYPSAFFLTGPTMHEFRIVEASTSRDCASDAIVLAWGNGSPSATEREETALMKEALAPGTDPSRRLDLLRQVTARNPGHYGAHRLLAGALDGAGEKRAALRAWRETRRLELLRSYGGADAAYSRERIRLLSAEVGE